MSRVSDVEGCQVEQASQLVQAQLDTGAQAVRLSLGDTGRDPIERRAHIRQCRRAGFGGPTRQPGRLGQQGVDLLLGDVQTLEFVDRALHFPRAVDRRLDQQVDALQFGKDVVKRILESLACLLIYHQRNGHSSSSLTSADVLGEESHNVRPQIKA